MLVQFFNKSSGNYPVIGVHANIEQPVIFLPNKQIINLSNEINLILINSGKFSDIS